MSRPQPTPIAPDDAAEPTRARASTHTQPVSSPDMIFREIVQGLYKGSYVPGQRLVESDLTQKWGVSRGTVREALNRLAAERIVVLNRHRGATIRVLDSGEIREILTVLEMLIGLAARLAAGRIELDGNRLAFQQAYAGLMSFAGQPDSYDLLRARNRFYRTLAAIGGNRELQGMLAQMHVHLVRIQIRALSDGLMRERFEDYRAIGEAVLAGKPRQAELAGRRHVRANAAVVGVEAS